MPAPPMATIVSASLDGVARRTPVSSRIPIVRYAQASTSDEGIPVLEHPESAA